MQFVTDRQDSFWLLLYPACEKVIANRRSVRLLVAVILFFAWSEQVFLAICIWSPLTPCL